MRPNDESKGPYLRCGAELGWRPFGNEGDCSKLEYATKKTITTACKGSLRCFTASNPALKEIWGLNGGFDVECPSVHGGVLVRRPLKWLIRVAVGFAAAPRLTKSPMKEPASRGKGELCFGESFLHVSYLHAQVLSWPPSR